MNGPGRLEITVDGPRGEPIGAIAIDSMIAGGARGGVRISPRADVEEVRPLARAMTLKYGFLGLPQGGAKAAVRGDAGSDREELRRRLVAFARATAPLLRAGVYLPDSDVGTRNEDVRLILRAAGVRPKRREWRGERSGEWTAVTVRAALRATASRVGVPLAESRVAIEGFGAVGSALARLVDAEGGRVVAVSTVHGSVHDENGLDVARLLASAAERGDGFVRTWPAERAEAPTLSSLDVDYLCPCAVNETIHEGNADAIRARAIVPGANAPMSLAVEGRLHERGITIVPDFLANCGGVLGGTLEFAGVDEKGIHGFVHEEVEPRIGRILDRARREGVRPREIAEPLADANHEAARRAAESSGATDAIRGVAVELHRRGLAPRRLVRRAALSWLRRSIVEVG